MYLQLPPVHIVIYSTPT